MEKIDFLILLNYNHIHLLKVKKLLNVLNVDVIQKYFVKNVQF